MGGPLLADNIIVNDPKRDEPAVIQPGKGGFADGSVIELPRRRVEAANDGPGKNMLGEVSAEPAVLRFGDKDMEILREQPGLSVPGKNGLGEIDPSFIERLIEMLRQPIDLPLPSPKGGLDGNRIDPGALFPGKNVMTLENVIPIRPEDRIAIGVTPGKAGLSVPEGPVRELPDTSPGKAQFTPAVDRQPIAIEVPTKGGIETAGPARIEPTDALPGKTPAAVEQDRVPVSVMPGKVAMNDPSYDNVIRVDPAVFTSGKNDFSQTQPPAAGTKLLEATGFSLADISSSMAIGNGGGMAAKLNVSMGGTPATPAAPATSALDDLANGSGNGRFDQSVYERAKAAMKQSGPGNA